MESEEYYFKKVCENCRNKGNEGKLCDDCPYIRKDNNDDREVMQFD